MKIKVFLKGKKTNVPIKEQTRPIAIINDHISTSDNKIDNNDPVLCEILKNHNVSLKNTVIVMKEYEEGYKITTIYRMLKKHKH